MSIENKPGQFTKSLLLTPIRLFIESRSDIVIERNDTIGLKPPYVIISNHVNNWDPLFLNCYIDEPICYIAGEPLFRHPLLKHVLNYAGAIRKTKFTNDTSTIRNVLKAKKHNRVIGIFPEGNRNWDGVNEPIIYSTAKLIKLLNLPVVVAKIKGGYLSHPRWGDGHRKGKIIISFEKKWDYGDFNDLNIDDIHQQLTEAMHHDEMAWQSEQHLTYEARHPAHYLERLLFICPHCHTPGDLHSSGDQFKCFTCNYQVKYTPFGTFESSIQKVYFNTPHKWKVWQESVIEQHFRDFSWKSAWETCLKDPVRLYRSNDKNPFKLIGEGTITWQEQQFIFQSDQKVINFDFTQAEGVNIQFHHKLDFLYDGDFYRMVFYQPRSSAYKWLQFAKQIQKQKALGVMEHG